MLIERLRSGQHWSVWLEAVLLLAGAPFLLFPTFSVVGTFVALCLIAASWLLPLAIKDRPAWPATPFNFVFLLWALTLIVGIVATADPDLTLAKATGLILGLAAWRYLVIAVKDGGWLALAALAFVVLGLAFTALGALAADWFYKVPFLDVIVSRLPAGLIAIPESPEPGVHTNQLAGTILVYLPLLFSLLGWRPRSYAKFVRAGVLLLALLVLVLLVLTQSRSGWIGGIGGLFCLFCLWGAALPQGHRGRAVIWGAVAVMVLAGALTLAWIGPERLQSFWEEPAQTTALGSLSTLAFRQETWRWALVSVEDFPFTGSGLGAFRQVARRLYPIDVEPTFEIAHAHNIYLQTAVDLGLPGLVVYLAILLVAAVIGWQVARQDEGLRPLVLGLLAGLAALHIFGVGDALALGSKPGLLFWVALGLLAAAGRVQGSGGDRDRDREGRRERQEGRRV